MLSVFPFKQALLQLGYFFKNHSAASVKKDIPGHFQPPVKAQECCATDEKHGVIHIQTQRFKAMSLRPQGTKQYNPFP